MMPMMWLVIFFWSLGVFLLFCVNWSGFFFVFPCSFVKDESGGGTSVKVFW